MSQMMSAVFFASQRTSFSTTVKLSLPGDFACERTLSWSMSSAARSSDVTSSMMRTRLDCEIDFIIATRFRQRAQRLSSLRRCDPSDTQPQLFQFQLHGMIARGFRMNFGRRVAFHFERSGDDFPACFTAMHFKTMLDQFTALLFRTGDRYKNPFVRLQPFKRFHLAVRDRDGLSVNVHRLNP